MQVANELSKFLSENLVDLNERRRERGGSWIYTDIPRLDNTMPRIGIFPKGSTMRLLGIGSRSSLEDRIIQISIFVNKGSKYEIDGELQKSEYVLDWITDKIIKLIWENINEFRCNNIWTLIPFNIVSDLNSDIQKIHIEYELKLTR